METTKKTPGRKKMHATASDRQRAYLKRCALGQAGIASTTNDPGQGVKRLDVLLPASVANKLDRLARHCKVSRASLLTKWIENENSSIVNVMTEAELDKYLACE